MAPNPILVMKAPISLCTVCTHPQGPEEAWDGRVLSEATGGNFQARLCCPTSGHVGSCQKIMVPFWAP